MKMLAEPQHREIAPAAHRKWLETQQDKVSKFDEELGSFIKLIGKFEEVAKSQLYSNQEFTELDLRFHRLGLAGIISSGERAAILLVELLDSGSIERPFYETNLALIDQRLGEFTRRMQAWHGAPENHADIPQDFKTGMTEIADGKVVDMNRALAEKP